MKNRILTLDKEKIEKLNLQKREILVYTLISLVDGSYTPKQMCGILGIGFQLYKVEEYCKNLEEKNLIKRNGNTFILT